MNKNIIVSITISFFIILFAMYMIAGKSNNIVNNNENMASAQNISITDGIQYVTIKAGGGYSPKVSTIKSGIPTKLIIKTNNTYDCSSALSIPSLNIRKMLQPTGEEVIDLGSPESEKIIDGTCSMGMYRFQIKVE